MFLIERSTFSSTSLLSLRKFLSRVKHWEFWIVHTHNLWVLWFGVFSRKKTKSDQDQFSLNKSERAYLLCYLFHTLLNSKGVQQLKESNKCQNWKGFENFCSRLLWLRWHCGRNIWIRFLSFSWNCKRGCGNRRLGGWCLRRWRNRSWHEWSCWFLRCCLSGSCWRLRGRCNGRGSLCRR